jgi:hypothetical protein
MHDRADTPHALGLLQRMSACCLGFLYVQCLFTSLYSLSLPIVLFHCSVFHFSRIHDEHCHCICTTLLLYFICTTDTGSLYRPDFLFTTPDDACFFFIVVFSIRFRCLFLYYMLSSPPPIIIIHGVERRARSLPCTTKDTHFHGIRGFTCLPTQILSPPYLHLYTLPPCLPRPSSSSSPFLLLRAYTASLAREWRHFSF